MLRAFFSFSSMSRTNSMFERKKEKRVMVFFAQNTMQQKDSFFSCACLHSNWPAVPAAIGGSSPLQEEEEAMDLCHRPEPESHAVETVEIFFFRRENRFTHRSIDYNRTPLHCGGQRKRQKFRERNSLHKIPKQRAFSRTILFRVAMPWPKRELWRWNEDRSLKSGRDLFF